MQREPVISQKDSDENQSVQPNQQSKNSSSNQGAKPYKSSELLMVKFNAVIRSGFFKDFQTLSILYTVYNGKNWKQVSGQNSGVSQMSYSPQGRIIWNFPIEITFQTDYLANPPQLIFVVYGNDFFGRSIPKAYGNIHFPLRQGPCRRIIHMFKVNQYSFVSRMYSLITGSYYQFKQIQSILNSSQHRANLRTFNCGQIQIQFETKRYNFQKYGYDN